MGNNSGTQRVNKPRGCPVRKAPPIGALVLCRERCYFFEECKKVSAEDRAEAKKKEERISKRGEV